MQEKLLVKFPQGAASQQGKLLVKCPQWAASQAASKLVLASWEAAATSKGVHNIFHISLLKKYEAGGDRVTPPETLVVDENTEFEVEHILGHR